MDSDENDFRNGFDKFYLCGESGDHTVKDGRVFVRGAPSERDNFQTLNKICRRAHIWSKNNKNCNKHKERYSMLCVRRWRTISSSI